jgi:hypothetical protein
MSRGVNPGISTNGSNRLGIIIMLVLSLLLFMVPLTMVYAGDYGWGPGGRGGYYEGDGFQSGEMGERGNGATGGLAAVLLVLANVTVLLSLILKGINRIFPMDEETKASIRAFNSSQKKYLKGLHYYLNPIAICIAFIHFHLSTCRSILPDAALILFFMLGVMGVVLRFRLCAKGLYKMVYSLHCSWIVFAIVIMLLTIGHATI